MAIAPPVVTFDMDGRQLKELLIMSCTLRENFVGVYARDSFTSLLASRDDVTGAFLINQSPRGERGTHWMSMQVTEVKGRRTYIFFDPLGQGRPSELGIAIPPYSRNRLASNVFYNTLRTQSEGSSNCGLHCLYVLHWLTLRVNFHDIMESFSATELEKNEEKVLDFSTNLKRGLFLHC